MRVLSKQLERNEYIYIQRTDRIAKIVHYICTITIIETLAQSIEYLNDDHKTNSKETLIYSRKVTQALKDKKEQ